MTAAEPHPPATEKRQRPAAPEATRLSLVKRLKDLEDQGGWQRFYDTYQGAIRGLAQRAGLSSAAADDVVQETLIAVARSMPKFEYDRSKGSFKGWLFQITRRCIADHFRKESVTVSIGLDLIPGTDEQLEKQWDEEWRRSLLDRITRLLGVNRAQVYMARMRVGKILRKEATRLGLEAGDLP
jgi:RNA polymerase sigma factor (sigma-70 family)